MEIYWDHTVIIDFRNNNFERNNPSKINYFVLYIDWKIITVIMLRNRNGLTNFTYGGGGKVKRICNIH